MDANSSSQLHSAARRVTTYHTLPSYRRNSEFDNADYSGDALFARRSAVSDPGISFYDNQLTQLQHGVSLGLEGYSSWLNLLLVFVPLGICAGFLKLSDALVFTLNFVGMIPLAMLLGKATEDIATHTNETLGALANVTFGNAVELILSFMALRQGKMKLIQNTISGSVLSNLLLVLGSAFFFGGLRYREQIVLPAVSEANADLLSFAVFGFSIPAVFTLALSNNPDQTVAEESMSLVTSVCLLVIYAMYLFFQLYTHAELYQNVRAEEAEEEGEGGEVASLPMALGILIGMVMLVAVSSELLVGSIDGFSRSVGLGEKFIAVVLLPVIGNAVEHLSAILVARHNKIDLSIGIACGSSVQIALFAAPLLVVVSWMGGYKHLTLGFELFDTVCLAFSVFVVNATLRDSRSNWLEGAVLVMCYFILAAAFYFMG